MLGTRSNVNVKVKVDLTVESGYYATATTSAAIPAKGSVTKADPAVGDPEWRLSRSGGPSCHA